MKPIEEVKILLICMNYNNGSEIKKYIDNVRKQKMIETIHMIIVENSKEQDYEIIEQTRKYGYDYICPGSNLGYFGGARYAIDYYSSKFNIPEYVIISNTDIQYPESNFFEKLLNIKLTNVGVIAPYIFSSLKKKTQNPYLINRPSKTRLNILKIIYYKYFIFYLYQLFSYSKSWITNLIKKKDNNITSNIEIYAPHGSYIILTKNYFSNGGKIDYNSFLFGEENFLGEEVLRLSIKVYYVPTLRIIHNEHSTTGIIKSKIMYQYAYESLLNLYDRFYRKG